ncbi:MAG: ribosomal RNA small subunit methyltransferase A [Elusimicrobia bacterium RIFOXYB2_FULL_49_7]|nr:MAG: ribosomal RNA small subunit methyltransferase A [Elusimicrobia bacterium RIFOXYB2_FULL_49_7]
MKAKKRFGQVFLTDTHYIRSILNQVPERPEGTIMEIGPGQGAITSGLVRKCSRLLAFEIDPDACIALQPICRTSPHLTLLQQDVLTADLHRFRQGNEKWLLVGNLPYNVGNLILFKLLEYHDMIESALFMVQREVGDRLVALPGEKAYSFLTASLSTFASFKRLFHLPPGAFRPIPNVESTFLKMTPLENPCIRPGEREAYLKLVSLAFSQRRKKAIRVLEKGYPRETLNRFFAEKGLDDNVRAETFPPALFADLFHAVANPSGLT